MSTKRYLAAAVLAVIPVAMPMTGLTAQTVWTHTDAPASIELELLRPDFSEELDFSFGTSAGFVTARFPLKGSWGVVADLPFSRAGWDGESGPESSSLVGNPYVGVEWGVSSRLTTGFGVRIPVGEVDDLSDLAPVLVGIAGEMERLEAFVPQTLGLYATADYRAPLTNGLSLRLRGGPAFLGGDGGPDDLLLGYTGQLWYGRDRLNVGTGLAGRANLTTDDAEADRTAHQVVVAGDYAVGRLRPGLQLRVPLDQAARDVSDYTLAVSLGWMLGTR